MKALEKILKMLNSKKEETEERIYILDTCALNSSEAMQIIEEASKVIILTGTIKELDDHKNDEGNFGKNIRAFGKKSRIDEKSEKYVCVAGYEKHSYKGEESEKYICINGYKKYKYQDDNIIDYCKEHKNVTILTCDNYLCNMAKAYGIPYIFPNLDEEKVQVKNVQKGNIATNVSYAVSSTTKESLNQNNNLPEESEKRDLSSLNIEEENSTDIKEAIQNPKQEIIFYKRCIRVQNRNNYANYIRVERQGKLIKTQDYTEGDLLYLLKYNKKKKNLKIYVYEIVMKNNQYVAEKLNEYKIWMINEIYRLKFSEELKDEIRSFFVKYA